jgi:hypothetical protein
MQKKFSIKYNWYGKSKLALSKLYHKCIELVYKRNVIQGNLPHENLPFK